jgi:aspartyl-tRNA(Asn)/glutamyl-tRNA(Gln) amidotransferase subunit A
MILKNLTADTLVEKYKNREIAVQEVIEGVFDDINRIDPDLGAFIHTQKEAALEEARGIDQAIANGQSLAPLAGVPVAVKDNMNIQGVRTTCGSKILEEYVPSYTSTAVDRLRQAGAIVVGKTNLDEFAMGSSTENSAFFPTRNPHDHTRVPGGSSGGSAAAVAAGLVTLSLGSDTGGSIRQPASFCGVVGFKPTYGRVSRYGLVAFASSLDQIGPFSRTVRESAQVLQAICGFDPMDSTSAEVGVDNWIETLDQPVQGLRLGIPKEYFVDGMDKVVSNKIQTGITTLEGLGCEVKQVSLPHTNYAVATYYLIATAEASSNLARYDGVRYGFRAKAATLQEMYRQTRMRGFGNEVKRRILLGTYALSTGYYDAYYLKAQKVRTLILRDFQKAFENVDLIVTPTCPTTAFKIGEKTDDPLSMYLSDIFTLTCNLAGLPGISVPCGKTSDGMPIGMQLLGNHFEEGKLLRVAHQFEQAGGFDS